MKKFSGMIIAAVCLPAFAGNVNPPFHAQPLNAFSETAFDAKSVSRLKVTLAGAEAVAVAGVRLGNVTLCSETACFRPAVPGTVQISDTSKGLGTLIVDSEFPYETIRSIYFETVTGANTISGSIKLAQPLKMERDYQGGEMMISLRKQVAKGSTTYVPAGVATNLLRDTGTSIYYDPRTATSVALPMGVKINFPAGATPAAQVFNVAVHDTGDSYPLLDIFPAVSLSKAATISMGKIERVQSAAELAGAATPRPKAVDSSGQKQTFDESIVPATSTFEIKATGVVRGGPGVHTASRQKCGDCGQ
jgi:hypothetical protein